MIIITKWTKLKKRVAVRHKKLLELAKLVGVFRVIEDIEGALQDLEVLFSVQLGYTARNAQVAASLLSPSRYQDAFASLAPA